MTNLTTMDKLAMYVGGGLIILGIPVMGLIVTLGGSMSPLYAWETADKSGTVLAPSMAPEGASIVTSPIFDPVLRGYLVLLGLAIFMLLGVYKLFTPEPSA